MARPKKNNAEYFTHDADMRNDVKIKALRRKFQHTGYAVWNFLLESLTDSDYFEIERNAINLELLAADYDVSVETLNEIIDYCLKIGLLQEEGNRLFSDAHQRRFAPLLANRERKRVIDGNNPAETRKKGVTARRNTGKTDETDVSESENPIVKESKGNESKGKEKYPYEDIIARWNSTCASLPKVTKLTDERRKKIKCRLQEFGESDCWLQTIDELFQRVEASKFLRGESGNWAASFDWLFSNSANWVKVMEGNYDDKDAQAKALNAKLGCGERIENGRRTYGTGKATIPMSAPPRPNERYGWDAGTERWVML